MTPPPYTQIESTSWPSGYAEVIAVARPQPELFARAFGLRFTDGFDNLDRYVAAPVRLRSGRIVGLLRHAEDPGPGTQVYADAGDDFVAALREFLDVFDLSSEDLSWVREDIPARQLKVAEERLSA